jgi:phosphoglycerate dehydrogenase-like enzyme
MKVLVGPNHFGLEAVIPELEERHPKVEFVFCEDRENLVEAIADADVYFGWLRRPEFLAAKRLRWIQSPSSGVDYYLQIPEIKVGDVLLTNARGTHGACLAESALASIFAFTRGIKASLEAQSEHRWANREIRPKMVELTGQTLGILGFGTVGRALAERARAFGCRILAVDAYPGEKPDYVARLGGLEGLEAMLRESDYVVVTVPRTAETRGMLGPARLALLKPTAILVCVSRGGIIDEKALAEMLREGRLKAAALDVFEPEPPEPDSPLWDLENCLMTPHIAGGSQFEVPTIWEIFQENLDRYLGGDLPLRNVVDKDLGF